MPTLKMKLETLRTEIKDYVRSVRNRKSVTAFTYKATNAPTSTPNSNSSLGSPIGSMAGTIQQRNVVAVEELINHVLTANKLGFQTYLTAGNGELTVTFIEPVPSALPFGWV